VAKRGNRALHSIDDERGVEKACSAKKEVYGIFLKGGPYSPDEDQVRCHILAGLWDREAASEERKIRRKKVTTCCP